MNDVHPVAVDASVYFVCVCGCSCTRTSLCVCMSVSLHDCVSPGRLCAAIAGVDYSTWPDGFGLGTTG